MQESHIGGGVYIVYPPHTIPTGPGGDIVCTEQQETLINDVSAQLNRRQNKNLETSGGPRCHHGIVHLPDWSRYHDDHDRSQHGRSDCHKMNERKLTGHKAQRCHQIFSRWMWYLFWLKWTTRCKFELRTEFLATGQCWAVLVCGHYVIVMVRQ